MKHRVPLKKQELNRLIGKLISIVNYSNDTEYYLSNYYNLHSSNANKFDWVITRDTRSIFIWPGSYDLLQALNIDTFNLNIWIEIQ